MLKELQEFAEKMETFKAPEWSSFPDIDLYMDQVITFLDKLPSVYNVHDEMQITSNMVNNYVKDGYISRPKNKKYDRDQLIHLFLLAQLKAILPIPMLASGLKKIEGGYTLQSLYEKFSREQEESFKGIAERIRAECSVVHEDPVAAFFFALRLAAEANALRLAAEQLLMGSSADDEETSGAKT